MKKKHIDAAFVRELVEDCKLQIRLVAEAVGVHEETLRRFCSKNGIIRQRTGPRSGEGHPEWRGGRTLQKGYWYIYSPDHPHRDYKNRMLEHRLVMEQKLGRLLHPKEVVHHIDGNSLNNHPDNLAVFHSNGHHLAETLKGQCPNWTPEGLENMRRRNQPQIHIRRKHKESDDRPQPQTTPPNPT